MWFPLIGLGIKQTRRNTFRRYDLRISSCYIFYANKGNNLHTACVPVSTCLGFPRHPHPRLRGEGLRCPLGVGISESHGQSGLGGEEKDPFPWREINPISPTCGVSLCRLSYLGNMFSTKSWLSIFIPFLEVPLPFTPVLVFIFTKWCDITPCSPVQVIRNFVKTYRLHIQSQRISLAGNQYEARKKDYSSALKKQSICSSETSVTFHCATRHFFPEERTFHIDQCENLRSVIQYVSLNSLLWWPSCQYCTEDSWQLPVC
jgi:hypothetical protein